MRAFAWATLALVVAGGCAATPAKAVADTAVAAETVGGVDATADSAKAVTLAEHYTLTAQFPEGGAWDSGGQAFYVGSLGNGAVHKVDGATGTETEIFKETAPGKWWTLGMDVDVARGKLWVCAMDDKAPPPRAGYIWTFDLATGKRLANVALSKAAADATCTDVAVTKDGSGYVVDREQPNVYKIDAADKLELFATGPDLKGTLAGQNAAVMLPDESALLSVVYLTPKLVRVDLKTKAVKAVQIDGPFTDDSLLAGADGMAYAAGNVYVAFTSKLVRVVPKSADWAAATATAVDLTYGQTDVIATPAGLYLLNGQAVRFALQQPTDAFGLSKFTGKF